MNLSWEPLETEQIGRAHSFPGKLHPTRGTRAESTGLRVKVKPVYTSYFGIRDFLLINIIIRCLQTQACAGLSEGTKSLCLFFFSLLFFNMPLVSWT